MTVPNIDWGEAERFLTLLGKTPETARLRSFPHRHNANRKTIGSRKDSFNQATAQRWQNEQRGIYLVINNGGDKDEDITSCVAFFVEWDNKPLDWQLTAWQSLGFGEPSIIVTTGGKSAHCYWVLDLPIPPDHWQPIQSALIAATAADPVNRNPSRVMRLPGGFYIGPNGNATGQTKIHSSTDNRYTPEDIEAWLVALPVTGIPVTPQGIPLSDAPSLPLHPSDHPPHTIADIRSALAAIPPRPGPGTGTYGIYRNILWGLIRACEEAGGDRDLAISLMESHSPDGWDIRQVAESGGDHIAAGTFWYHARQAGWRPPATARQERPPSQTPGIPVVGTDAKAGAGAGQQGGHHEAHQQSPSILSLSDVRERLRYAVENGASRQDLEALRIELATAADMQPATLRDLLRAIQAEHEAAAVVAHEAASIRDAVERRAISQILTLDYLLPPSLAHALRYRTQWLPTDDIATACTFLIGMSGLIKLGSEVIASEAASYRVPLNLYGALVARSGAKKSPISRILVSDPTHEIRLLLAAQHQRARDNWQEQNRGVKPSERSDEPRAAYCSISDATAEALASQLQCQEERGLGLLIHRDELAGLIGGLNQYRGGRGSDSEQLLEAYDGGGFRSLRVAANGGGRFYSRCHLSIYGTIQPAILRSLVADGDASGLWARFLMIPLPERVVPLPVDETPEQTTASTQAAQLLASVADYVWRLPRTSLALDISGRERFFCYEARCQADALAATLPAQSALYGKAPGKVLRLAGVLHLLAGSVTDGWPSPAIDAAAIDRAVAVIDHLTGWTLGLHADAAAGEASDLMRQIHRIATTLNRPVGWRDVAQRLSKAARTSVDSSAAAAAAEALAEIGAGVLEQGARGSWSYRATEALP